MDDALLIMEKLRILLLTHPQSEDRGKVEKPDLDDEIE